MELDVLMMKERLEGEYREVFERAALYSEVRELDDETEQEMMMNLLDVLLTAQSEGKPVQKVVGGDIEEFCSSYFSGYTLKHHLLSIPHRFYRFFWVVLVLELLSVLASEDDVPFMETTVDISGYFVGLLSVLLIMAGLNFVLRPVMFRWKWLTATVYDAASLILFLATAMVFSRVFEDYSVDVPAFWVLAVCGSYVLVYIIIRSVKRYRRYGHVRKRREKRAGAGMMEQMKQEIPSDLVKRYERINKRRMRKGKPELTPEEYMEKLRKDIKTERWGDVFAAALVLLVVICIVVQVAVTSTWYDTLFFILILAVVEIPAMFLFRVSGRSLAWRRELLDECDRRGITVLEYVERRDENECD